ncbi:hypothetical protein [Photorhabdus tasmaniensis]|uniref:hypothetical protein n=1 Tax=Photorhabdus tasmaniensis TaxID=1004159 RepID=UPI00105E456F|nr:hypothetical protein [Photorhabdus tasmaniensis]
MCLWLGDRWAGSRLLPQINQEIENRKDAELTFYRAQKEMTELNASALQKLIEKQQAQQHANEKMSNDLYAALTRLSQTTQRIEQRIPEALARDGNTYTGIGPDGLQLYQAALGYRRCAISDFRMPDHPADIAAHTDKAVHSDIGGTACVADSCQPVRPMEPGTGTKAPGHQSLGGQTTGKAK